MSSDFPVVAILAAYNEADIITHVIGDLIDQGVDVYFLDDGSTDGTVAAVEPFVGRGVIAIEPAAAPGDRDAGHAFEWERILLTKTRLATTLDAAWFIHHDADEFRESPWPAVRLKEAIQKVDALGFNAIDFRVLDFWPVHDRFRAGQDVREAFTAYAVGAEYDRVQIRCWKKTADLDLVSSGGHEARFPGRNVFPLRFILRHYPIRGQAHGERKVFHERRGRFVDTERARGWHVQYDAVGERTSFLRDPSDLTPYDADAVRLELTLRPRGVEELDESLADARKVAETLRRDLEQHRAELARHRVELERCCADLARMHGELSARTAELAAVGNLAEERAVELTELRGQLAAKTAEAHGVRDALHQRLDEIERWKASVADTAGRLDEVHRSRTWRWTAPARAAFRLLGGS